MAYFSGKVSSIIFSNTDQAFYILKMLLDGTEVEAGQIGQSLVSIKGYIPGINIQVGSWFGWEGKWVEHAEHGKQIAVTEAPVFRGRIDPETVVNLLTDNGVTSMIAYQLRTSFGGDLSEALGDAERIKGALGLSTLEAEFLVDRWSLILRKMKTLEALNKLDLPKAKVGEIWAYFGEETEEILATNPWALVSIAGISFTVMDGLARTANLPMDCLSRRCAAVTYAAREERAHGDLYMTANQLIRAAMKTAPGLIPKDIAEAVKVCYEKGEVIIDPHTRPGTAAIYSPWFYKLEKESASLLRDRVNNASLCQEDFFAFQGVGPKTEEAVRRGASNGAIVQTAIEESSQAVGISLSPEQTQGVFNALMHPISVLTGLPGTGKSTSMKVLVRILQMSNLSILLVAPTGIAAKRLGSVCQAPAFTIHRAMGAKGDNKDDKRESTYIGITGESKGLSGTVGQGELWTRTPANPHPARVIIVDEFSMVDQHLLYRLLVGTGETARVVCVGDAAQLPSVGPGNVLRDLISSGELPTTALTQIYRQEDTSDIVTAAHAIYRGEVPPTGRDTDFVLLPVREEEKVLETVVRIAQKLYTVTSEWEEEMGDDKAPPSFQVLSPRHMGTVGVTNLNAHLRRVINPKNPVLKEIKMGNEVVREGDRVMVVKNNYDLNVFNGDIGKVVKINRRSKEVKVKIHGTPPMYVSFSLREAFSHLRLAYACTVHKYQGLEVDTVVMPLVTSFRHQLQRNLLYTAITRAKKKVILVGSPAALERAVLNDKEDRRNTLFEERLKLMFSAEEETLSVQMV